MKHIDRIKLASALLGALLLLTSCGREEPPAAVGTDTFAPTVPDTETEAGTEAKDPNLGPVEPLLKNFFAFSGVGTQRELSGAAKLAGECVSITEDSAVAVFREAKVDLMNRVTETFTVYHVESGKTALTLNNSYDYGNYHPFDWENLSVKDPAVRYPSQVMSVSAETFSDDGMTLHWVEVRRARITPITPAEGGDLYEIKTTYDYYDVAGNKIVSTTEPVSVSPNIGEREELSFRFGSVNALFDGESEALISVSGADGEIIRYGYTHATERYGYYLSGIQPSALGRVERFLEVYLREDGSRVLRYYPDPCDELSAFPLGNGDLLLQYRNLVEEDSGIAYDYRNGEDCYSLDTYLLDVRTGKTTEVECDYYIQAMYGREEMEELFGLSRRGIALTEYAQNICVACPLEHEALGESALIVLDHDASLLFSMDRIIPEHRIGVEDPFGMTMLSDGGYLVRLNHVSAECAIVSADGRVRSYLRSEEGARIVGSYVVTADGIYDYDLNLLYSFAEGGFTLFATVGDKILVTKTEEDPDTGVFCSVSYEIYRQDGVFMSARLFEGREMELVSEERDYLILRDADSGKYSMYNTKLAHLLTTESEMWITPFEERYLARTVHVEKDGTPVELFYTVG